MLIAVALLAESTTLPASVFADNRTIDAAGPATSTTATWDIPEPRAVREQVFTYLVKQAGADAAGDIAAKAETLWPNGDEPRGAALLDRAASLLALVEPKAADVANYAQGAGPVSPWPHAVWLTDEKTPALVRDNLRLLVARRLVEARRFEDAAEVLKGLDAADVVDPAALLFSRAVAEHQLVRPEACAATAATLLENETLIPARYAAVARLMRSDIDGVKTGSLDDISRRMGNVGRRIELGQASRRTQELADEVVKSLDDLIKKAEDERDRQQPQPSGQAGGSGKPAEQSRPLEGKGEGKVERKNIGTGRDWGNLPAKARDEALQQVGKDFPAHYREIIEEYFRRLAAEDE
jgi:hypothetical protein